MMTPETNDEKTETSQQPQQKKPYAKPLTRRVELRPQEAVLGNCKQDVGACIIGSESLGS